MSLLFDPKKGKKSKWTTGNYSPTCACLTEVGSVALRKLRGAVRWNTVTSLFLLGYGTTLRKEDLSMPSALSTASTQGQNTDLSLKPVDLHRSMSCYFFSLLISLVLERKIIWTVFDSTTDQSKCLLRWHNHRDGGLLPRIRLKVKGNTTISDHNRPAAWDRGAERGIYWTCNRKAKIKLSRERGCCTIIRPTTEAI